MRWPWLLIAPALAGCATTGHLLEKEPRFKVTSGRSTDALEQCLALAFSGRIGTPTVVRGEGRRVLIWEEETISLANITIIEGHPSVIEVRWRARALGEKQLDKVRACAQSGS